MFETLDRDEQGDLGEARAIYELVRLGYVLSKPLHNHLPYDLVADKDDKLNRVSVKTSGFVIRKSTQVYQVLLVTTGGNTQQNTRKLFDATKVDFVFVMTDDDRCWLIPSNKITAKTMIEVGTAKYAEYQISGKVIPAFGKGVKQVTYKTDKRAKTAPFTQDELKELLSKFPTTEVGKKFNMSDNGVARWAKKWGISKPPRGYWQKKQVGKI